MFSCLAVKDLASADLRITIFFVKSFISNNSKGLLILKGAGTSFVEII